MELTIICPKCELLFSFKEERCQNEKCDYKIKTNKQEFLINISISAYNEAVSEIKKQNFFEAWNIFKKNLKYFPYIIENLKLGYYLSLLIGEYRYSQRLLNSLKKYLNNDEYEQKLKFQNEQIEYYNNIINNKDKDLFQNIDKLNPIHLFMLFDKYGNHNNELIIRRLKDVYPEVEKTMRAYNIDSYKTLYYKQLFIVILFYIIILALLMKASLYVN